MTTRIHLDEARAPDVDVTLRELLHFVGDGPVQGAGLSAPREVRSPTGSPFPTSIVWYRTGAQTTRAMDVTITRDAQKRPTTIVHRLYGVDGVTVVLTITDTVTYSGGWVLQRDRVIA